MQLLAFSFFSFYSMLLAAQHLLWPSLANSWGQVCPHLGPYPIQDHGRQLDTHSLVPWLRSWPSVHLARPGLSTVHTVPFVKTLPLVSWGD